MLAQSVKGNAFASEASRWRAVGLRSRCRPHAPSCWHSPAPDLTPEIVDVNRLVRGMVKLLNRTIGEQVRST